MGSQIKSLENEIQKSKNDTEPSVTVETLAPNAVNSTESTNQNDDQWFHCDLCVYKCKADKTIKNI